MPNITKPWWYLVIFGCFMHFFPNATILMNFKMSHYFWLRSIAGSNTTNSCIKMIAAQEATCFCHFKLLIEKKSWISWEWLWNDWAIFENITVAKRVGMSFGVSDMQQFEHAAILISRNMEFCGTSSPSTPLATRS